MPKGGSSRYRARGNSRTGLRDRPPGLAGLTAEQRAAAAAQREMRSAASHSGHEVRRANEAARLIDELTDLVNDDLDDDAALQARWAELTDRQRDLVSATLEAEEAARGTRDAG